MEHARRELQDVEYCDDAYACGQGADALVFVTEWAQFRALDLARLKREMAQPVIVDLRNIYRPDDMARLGFYLRKHRPARQNLRSSHSLCGDFDYLLNDPSAKTVVQSVDIPAQILGELLPDRPALRDEYDTDLS